MVSLRRADFKEGNNCFAAVQSILLILGEVDVFLFTNGIYKEIQRFAHNMIQMKLIYL